MKFFVITSMFLFSAASAYADQAPVDLKSVHAAFTSVAPILDDNSFPDADYMGVGFKSGQQVLSGLHELTLRNFDCYAITPIGTSARNPRFYESAGTGLQLKAGTKLVSIESGFTMGENWENVGYDGVKASAVSIYLQIVGRNAGPNGAADATYDLVLTCPATASTTIDMMLKNKWSIDLPEISKSFGGGLSGFFSGSIFVQ